MVEKLISEYNLIVVNMLKLHTFNYTCNLPLGKSVKHHIYNKLWKMSILDKVMIINDLTLFPRGKDKIQSLRLTGHSSVLTDKLELLAFTSVLID